MTDEERLDLLGHALADPTRRRLLVLLRESPGLTTGQLAAAAPGLTRWAVMKHLEVLRAAWLVQTLPEGRRRRHYRDPRGLDELLGWLERDRATAER